MVSIQIISARILLQYGANINARDDVFQSTPLAWAAMFGQREVVEFLLTHGAKPNLPDDEPWATPLFWAEHKGHLEMRTFCGGMGRPALRARPG